MWKVLAAGVSIGRKRGSMEEGCHSPRGWISQPSAIPYHQPQHLANKSPQANVCRERENNYWKLLPIQELVLSSRRVERDTRKIGFAKSPHISFGKS